MAIQGFVRIRDFLGVQLTHAWGNTSDEEFEAQADEHFRNLPKVSLEEARVLIPALLTFTGVALQGELLSELFGCELHEAETVLGEFIADSKVSGIEV